MKRVLQEIIRRIKAGVSDPYMLGDAVSALAALYSQDLKSGREMAKELWKVLNKVDVSSYAGKYAVVQASCQSHRCRRGSDCRSRKYHRPSWVRRPQRSYLYGRVLGLGCG